jgi:hypothetical protein
MRQRTVIRAHVVTERDAGRHLALVVGLVGGHFAPGHVAGDIHIRRDPQPIVDARTAALDHRPDRLEAQALERHRAPDLQQHFMPVDGRYWRPTGVDAASQPTRSRSRAGMSGARKSSFDRHEEPSACATEVTARASSQRRLSP